MEDSVTWKDLGLLLLGHIIVGKIWVNGYVII